MALKLTFTLSDNDVAVYAETKILEVGHQCGTRFEPPIMLSNGTLALFGINISPVGIRIEKAEVDEK